eukprot:GHVN01069455.1.p2 GENE.GHVN01069455.1~~GHVN01069455.1.p2  ORF type:complete len:241 (+),score=35.29 GHVN01069455.1:92-814(+)
MADVLSGGVLGTYLEDGLLSWKLKSAETLEGMGVLDADIESFSEVPAYFAALAERFAPDGSRVEELEFGSAFVATVMGLGIDTPSEIVSRTLASRLDDIPQSASQFDVLGRVMGLDVWNSVAEVENVLVQRFANPQGAHQVGGESSEMEHSDPRGSNTRGPRGTKSAESVPSDYRSAEMVHGFNMISSSGEYHNPGGAFIFPDRAITSLVGEGERRRHAAQRGDAPVQGLRGQLENLMPF